MITKDQLATSLIREIDICKHLHSKIPASAQDYRPTPTQRTTLELLQYLSICGTAAIRCMSEKNWKLFGQFSERAQRMTFEDFPAAMEVQKEEIVDFFETTSVETLTTEEAPLPGGGIQPLAVAILNGPLKWLTAYKMQLFLYAKASGAGAIGTANAWAGADRRA